MRPVCRLRWTKCAPSLFPNPVATVYVGNPAIADINMIDSRHAFVLGKGYGSTNLVALDPDGKQVSNTHINVLARQDASVTLQRGANRVTYSCTANHCEATPQPGDGKEAFDAASAQIGAHRSRREDRRQQLIADQGSSQIRSLCSSG